MRQTTFLKVIAALTVLGSAASAADSQLMSMVMPDAKILAGVNAGAVRMSPFGQFIIAKVATLGAEKFIAATGFDPLQDVSEVLVAGGADPFGSGGLFMARGNFNVDKIVAAAIANLPKTQVQSYSGATLLSGTNQKTHTIHALAFIGNSIAILGSLDSVEAAIARNGQPAAIDPALAAQVNQLGSTQDEWLVSSGSVASLLPANAVPSTGPAAQMLPILKNIQSFSGGVNFAANIQITGQVQTSDAQNATALAAVLKLGVTLASAKGGNNVQFKDMSQLLQAIDVTTSGSAVNVSLAIPETQVEAILNRVLTPPAPAARPHRIPNGK